MERQRRQHAEAAAVLHAALVCLNRGGVCREPLTPGMLARPNLKGLQAVMHLLHLRIRGAARTKKELQHIFPVLEPAQAKEFKGAMQAWVQELGAAGAVSPDTVKYFVSAYQGSSSHRTVLMLLDLCAVALAKELGADGPQSTLAGTGSTQPGIAAANSLGGRAAQRQVQDRLDAVVAAMQRLKQLHAQAVGQLACGQAAAGAPVQQLAPSIPPLFTGSQASTRRGELVLELLSSEGDRLTAKPEAVGPESWSDLLAGRGAGTAAPGAAAPSLARRLSNPAQEASNFAAEGLAADADVLTVHQVLGQRLTATGAALQAAMDRGGAVLRSAEVHSALAEAAAYRDALTLSVRQELVAAKVRAELQAPSSSSSGSAAQTLLQLPPPSLPPCNPVLEGMQAAEEAAASAATPAGSYDWGPPDAETVLTLRRSMWQRAQCGGDSGAGISQLPENGTPAIEAAAGAPPPPQPPGIAPVSPAATASAAGALEAGAEGGAAPVSPLLQQPPAKKQQQQALQHTAACGSSSSKAPQPVGRAATAVGSPSLADMISHASRGLALTSLMDEDLPEAFRSSPAQQQHRQQQGQEQQQAWPPSRAPLASPCMAESCASVSVVAENQSSGASSLTATRMAAGPRQGHARGRPMPPAASPMLSAAASFMQSRQRHEQSQQQQQQQQQQQWASSISQQVQASAIFLHHQAAAEAAGAGSPAEAPLGSLSPAGSTPLPLRRSDSGELDGAGMEASGGSSRRQSASMAFTLTPPRRLEDSPLPPRAEHQQQQQQQQTASLGGRVAQLAAPRCISGGDATPLSRPPPPAVPLQPVQPPDSPFLLASCLRSQPGAPRLSLLASPMSASPGSQPAVAGQAPHHQVARWALTPARSSSPAMSVDSPQGSGASSGGVSRRRSALHTTSSPACMAGARQQHASQAAASPLLTPPRSLVATPGGPGPMSHMHAGSEVHSGADSRAAAGSAGAGASSGADMAALKQRYAMLKSLAATSCR